MPWGCEDAPWGEAALVPDERRMLPEGLSPPGILVPPAAPVVPGGKDDAPGGEVGEKNGKDCLRPIAPSVSTDSEPPRCDPLRGKAGIPAGR